jgi:hypothetical protein
MNAREADALVRQFIEENGREPDTSELRMLQAAGGRQVREAIERNRSGGRRLKSPRLENPRVGHPE